MIRGEEVKIKQYLFIDRTCEGIGFIRSIEGEEIWGIPAGFIGDNSQPYIEHRRNGRITKSVNCSDVSIIEFE